MSASADVSKMLAGLKAAREKGFAAAQKAVDVFALQVLGDAQQMAPIDTGFLAGSGVEGTPPRNVEEIAAEQPIKVNGDVMTKEIGFNAEYGAAVHENLESHHDQGQAKFLEAAMRKNAPKFMPFVNQQVQKAMAK